MTVKQLISRLQKMPQNLQVGVSAGDNSPWEIADYPVRVELFDKGEMELPDWISSTDQAAYNSQPQRAVVIRC
jgi:hypothetical protein